MVLKKDRVFGMGQLLSKPINKSFSEVYLFLGELVVLLTRTKFFIGGFPVTFTLNFPYFLLEVFQFLLPPYHF